MGVSQVAELGEEVFLSRLEQSLARGLRLVQLREKQLDEQSLLALAARVREITLRHGARLMLNASPELAQRADADGVHLSAARLAQLRVRPDLAWCGASCHGRIELDRAAELALDYVVLGSVLPTATHPNAGAMGWEHLAELIRDYPLPVYAIGGMQAGDLTQAWRHGAHGVAMLRGAW